MKTLAKTMLAEATKGKTRIPADLVIIIDDLELGNLGQEDVVADHFRRALEDSLRSLPTSDATAARSILRENCSFHLLKPMVETYLFGDELALRTAGVPEGIAPQLRHTDVEQFEATDPHPKWVAACTTANSKARGNPAYTWWENKFHPKHYLEHLLGFGGTIYEETNHGRRALANLRFPDVPKATTEAPLIRSLFEDLSTWFGVANPLAGESHPAFYPGKTVRPETRILRNM
jgi:hypothetical protein